MIDKQNCHAAVDENPGLSADDKARYAKMCDDGLSVGALFRDEIPKHGTCTLEDANIYIREEEKQMTDIFGSRYNMNDVSVAEHVLFEDREGEHAGLPAGYSGVPGDVKFFLEWLEGHHPSLACYFGGNYEVPGDNFYAEMAFARRDAELNRRPYDRDVPLFVGPASQR